MPNYENFLAFEYWQHEMLRHAFSFAAAVFAVTLPCFTLTAKEATQKYRRTFYVSGVLMVSTTIELGLLYLMWSNSFTYDMETMLWTLAGGQVFANGYRYANWVIDIQILLTQFLIVLQFIGSPFFDRWAKLTAGGAAMIVLGYIGQNYEAQVAGVVEGSGTPFWIWGGLSCLVFFCLLYVANDSVKTALNSLSEEAWPWMKHAWTLLLVTWSSTTSATLYRASPASTNRLNESSSGAWGTTLRRSSPRPCSVCCWLRSPSSKAARKATSTPDPRHCPIPA